MKSSQEAFLRNVKFCGAAGTASMEDQCLQKGLCSLSKVLGTWSLQPWLWKARREDSKKEQRGKHDLSFLQVSKAKLTGATAAPGKAMGEPGHSALALVP